MADATDIVREMINAWNAHDPDGVARLVSTVILIPCSA
jgi:hypothetical protein